MGYDTATQTFKPSSKPLPLPRKKNRKPRSSFANALPKARPFAPDPDSKAAGNPVKFPKGVSNGKY